MVIDSLISTEVYVEKKSLLKIIGSPTINKDGLLEVDSNQNSLISTIDSGDTSLYRLSKYSGADGLLLYNPTTKNIQIAKQGDILNVSVDFDRGTKYYVGAKLLKSTGHVGNIFDVALEGLNVFKIFMDGRELKTYSVAGNKITITGSDRVLIDDFSELIVYAYKTTVISSESDSFEIEYYQYDTIWDKDWLENNDYFESLKGIEINCFESTSITQNVTKTVHRGGFKFSTETRINSIDNTADFNIFSVSGLIDFVQYVGNEEFRIIFVNQTFGRVVLLNNCKTDNGVSLILEKAKNTKKFNLSCGNYIDLSMSSPSVYGKDRYSRGLYSSGVWINNSHRRSE